jgi:hypothetical protein
MALSARKVPASDRNVKADDNLPVASFHDEIVELGRQLREHEVGVETGKAAGMARFVRGAVGNEFDIASTFDRHFLDWRYGENVASKVDRKHASEMSRFRAVCEAAVVSKRLGGDFLQTIERVKATVDTMKASTEKDAPKPRQLDQAIYAVANAQKAATVIVPDAVIADKVATPPKAVSDDPLGDMLKALAGDIAKLLDPAKMAEQDIVIPKDWRIKLRAIKTDIEDLADMEGEKEPA